MRGRLKKVRSNETLQVEKLEWEAVQPPRYINFDMDGKDEVFTTIMTKFKL